MDPSRRERYFGRDIMRIFAAPVGWFESNTVMTDQKSTSIRNAQVYQCQATAALEFIPEEQGELTLRQKLDFKPALSTVDVLASILIPAAICAILYGTIRTVRNHAGFALGMSMIFAAWIAICRALLLERHYTERLVEEMELADEASQFATHHEVHVHYKVCRPSTGGSLKAALHCFHGFGANTSSWLCMLQQLADSLQAQVTAHDMPGFGLTKRPFELRKYSFDFNGSLGRAVMEAELLASKRAGNSGSESNLSNDAKAHSAVALPRILVGHSMGAVCAAAEAIRDPQAVEALVLISPAIPVLRFSSDQKVGKVEKLESSPNSCRVTVDRMALPKEERPRRKRDHRNVFLRLVIALCRALAGVAVRLFSRLLEPVSVVTLRAAVRSRSFWEQGLGKAWHDKAGVTADIVDAYRLPQLVKGWEKGLFRFSSARMSSGRSFWEVLRDAWRGDIPYSQVEMLAEVVAKHNIKVLIVHGHTDALVPASNSRRLAALIPSAHLKVMENTGHVPHEEQPQDFVHLLCQLLADLPE